MEWKFQFLRMDVTVTHIYFEERKKEKTNNNINNFSVRITSTQTHDMHVK